MYYGISYIFVLRGTIQSQNVEVQMIKVYKPVRTASKFKIKKFIAAGKIFVSAWSMCYEFREKKQIHVSGQ